MNGERSSVAEAARLILACILPLSVPLSGCVTTTVGTQDHPDGGTAGATGCAEAALLYVGTNTACTTFAGAYGAYAALARTSCWQELTLDLGNPTTQAAGYDPTSVFDFGVQFYTGSAGASAGPVTFLVDSFSIE